MPELPEVEIVKQSLAKKIQQKKIKKVIILTNSLILVFITLQTYQKNIIMLKFNFKI